MKKLNIAKLLKDCPKGLELDCTICDNVYFDEVTPYMIKCHIKSDTTNNSIYFHHDGSYLSYSKAKCVIFPKGKTTWEGFQRPFKDGDILYIDCNDNEDTYEQYQYIFILYPAGTPVKIIGYGERGLDVEFIETGVRMEECRFIKFTECK